MGESPRNREFLHYGGNTDRFQLIVWSDEVRPSRRRGGRIHHRRARISGLMWFWRRIAATVALCRRSSACRGRAVTVGGAVGAKEGYESLIPRHMRRKFINELPYDLIDLLRLENRRQQIPGSEYRSPDPAHSFLHNRRRATRIRRKSRSWTPEEAGLTRLLDLCRNPG